MVTTETEEIVRQQRVNEHKTILDMIALLDKRLSKVEDAVPVFFHYNTLLVTLENLETRLNKIVETEEDNFLTMDWELDCKKLWKTYSARR